MSLEDVTAGAQILGIAGDAPVTVVAVTWIMRLHRHTEAIEAGAAGKEPRPDNWHRFRQGPGIHHPHRSSGSRSPGRAVLPAMRAKSDNRVPHERPGQQPVRPVGPTVRGTANKVVHHDG